jgi:hypothetical protein
MSFEAVVVSATQDLVALLAGAAKQLQIVRYWVGATDTTAPTAQQLSLRARVATATFSLGSGGSSGTVVKTDQGDGAASATGHVNDTTPATTTGAFFIVDEQGTYVFNGYDSAIQGRPTLPIPVNGGFVWQLLSNPTGTLHLSGGVDWLEIG